MLKNPFKFLEAFEKEDRDRFFGRTRELAQLYNILHASNLVMLYGASGTGKTSLINCGLANRYMDSDWLPLFVRRQDNLNQSLRQGILSYLDAGESYGDDVSIQELVRQLYLEHYRPVYLIFDQFEELYILGDNREQAYFHATIKELINAGLQCKVLLVIREEYIAYLSDFENAIPSLFDNRLRIEKMKDKNLRRVIAGTAIYGGINIENPKLTLPRIIENVRDRREGVDLTNLQVYLDQLWRKDIARQEAENPKQVTFDMGLVESVGKLEDILSDFLEEQFTQLEAGLLQRGMERPQGIPLEILFTLVTEEGTKRNMAIPSIIDALPKNRKIRPADVEYCIDEFERMKLLRKFTE